jgi:hypothetical protein
MPTAVVTATGRGLCKLFKGQDELHLEHVSGLEFIRPALGMQIQGQVSPEMRFKR